MSLMALVFLFIIILIVFLIVFVVMNLVNLVVKTKIPNLGKLNCSGAILFLSPVLAFFIVPLFPTLHNQKFISMGDGSVGSAFYVFFWIVVGINLTANVFIWVGWRRLIAFIRGKSDF